MNKFGMLKERINTILFTSLPSRTFLILHRDSQFLLNYLMYCLWVYSIIIPKFTWKYFFNFSNLQRNITSTEHLFILDAVLKPCWGVQHAFQKRSGTARPGTPKKWFYTSIWAVLYEKVLTRLSTARRLK